MALLMKFRKFALTSQQGLFMNNHEGPPCRVSSGTLVILDAVEVTDFIYLKMTKWCEMS